MQNQEIQLNVAVVAANSTDLKQPGVLNQVADETGRVLGANTASQFDPAIWLAVGFTFGFIFMALFVRIKVLKVKR